MTNQVSDRLLHKLQKLVNKERGARELGSLAEADAFAAKIQDLLVTHKLTMSEVELSAQAEADPIGTTLASGVRMRTRRVPWVESLAQTVAWAHFCRILVHTGSSNISFIGRNSDRQVCSYIFSVLVRFAEEQSQKDYHEEYWRCVRELGHSRYARGYRKAWLASFVKTIAARYWEREEERKRLESVQGNSVALVRLTNARQEVALWEEERFKKHASATKQYTERSNARGAQDGRRRGREVSLQPGIGGAGDGNRQLPQGG